MGLCVLFAIVQGKDPRVYFQGASVFRKDVRYGISDFTYKLHDFNRSNNKSNSSSIARHAFFGGRGMYLIQCSSEQSLTNILNNTKPDSVNSSRTDVGKKI